MSEDDANYDDFMMSDEEDMGVIEMEDETEDEAVNGIEDETEDKDEGLLEEGGKARYEIGRSDKCEKHNEQFLALQFEIAQSCADEQDFIRAREVYHNVLQYAQKNDNLVEESFKSITEILRSRSMEVHYSKISEEMCDFILHDFTAFVDFTNENYERIRSDVFQETVSVLLADLFPNLNREFLFAVESIDQYSLLLKMKLQMKCLQLFDDNFNRRRISLHAVNFGKISATIWHDRLEKGIIDQRSLSELQALCGHEDSTSRIDTICLILQCYICNFIENKRCCPETWTKYVDEFESMTASSISVSQRLGSMIQLHLSKAIIILNRINSRERGINTQEFHHEVQTLKSEFWECLQHIEEIGGSKQNFTTAYEKFILTGFTFTSMILHLKTENKINPFDLEQIKIAYNVPIVIVLRKIYDNFTALNLVGLYNSIQRLERLKNNFEGVIETIYHLAQLIKLWTKIAPVYSCLSFTDVQNLLKLDDTRCMTRDELLTILMKSIMNDNADLFYKLNLTKDLVYFGDENKVQLSMYPKESFKLNQKDTRDLEFANNIGIFDNPKSLKNLTLPEFFDSLQSSRDNVQSMNRNHEQQQENLTLATSVSTASVASQHSTGFQPTHMRYSHKYNELSELLQVKLGL